MNKKQQMERRENKQGKKLLYEHLNSAKFIFKSINYALCRINVIL